MLPFGAPGSTHQAALHVFMRCIGPGAGPMVAKLIPACPLWRVKGPGMQPGTDRWKGLGALGAEATQGRRPPTEVGGSGKA